MVGIGIMMIMIIDMIRLKSSEIWDFEGGILSILVF